MRTPVVAEDIWRREIKDRRRRPWGKPRPEPFCLFCTAYQSFYRAVQWFHRMKWKGLLPAPYDGLAAAIPERKTFREEPRPRGGPAAARRGGKKTRRAEGARLRGFLNKALTRRRLYIIIGE